MMTKILVVLLLSIVSIFASWQSRIINNHLETLRKTRCRQIVNSRYNGQFPHYCKVRKISVIGLDVGAGLLPLSRNNFFSFSGNVLRTSDVTFMTEQDGYGNITAKFNDAILQCSGFAAMKRKTCVIPRAMKPWTGRITVIAYGMGYNPSTLYRMIGKPVCRRAGYKVSANDFRLCEPDPPQIYSASVTRTVTAGKTTVLPCRHKPQPLATVKWQSGGRVIAIKHANGVTQTINDKKLTLRQNGDLIIKSVAYRQAGDFVCVVVNNPFKAQVKHTLKVESVPLMDVQHLISGSYTRQHAYRVGDNVTIDCLGVAMPVPSISWTKDSQALQTSQRLKVTQTKMKVYSRIDALLSRLEISGVQKSDAGSYTRNAANKYGTTTKAITVSVTK